MPTSGALTLSGKPSNLALAMIFSAPRSRSLIALLPTVFARAALFHPGWMGAWTFWALLVGLLVAAASALRSMLRRRGARRGRRPATGSTACRAAAR